MSAIPPANVAQPITVSVVSHGQIELLMPLLEQLERAAEKLPLHVIVTQNFPEWQPDIRSSERFQLTWVANERPLGFAENHNNAFRYCQTACFCVLNPDVRLDASSLIALRDCVLRRPGVAGPKVMSSEGSLEDSARQVPSIRRLWIRWSKRRFVADYSTALGEQQVDWLAGMCLAFDRGTYQRLDGFNTAFRLYCEDVDICLRSHLEGLSVTWTQQAVILHDAQRASHRRWRYLVWHICSLTRLMRSATYWRFRLTRRLAT